MCCTVSQNRAQSVAACCSVLQSVAVYCRVLLCVCVCVCCRVMQGDAGCCSVLQEVCVCFLSTLPRCRAHTHVYIHTYKHIHTHTNTYKQIHTHVRMHTHKFTTYIHVATRSDSTQHTCVCVRMYDTTSQHLLLTQCIR